MRRPSWPTRALVATTFVALTLAARPAAPDAAKPSSSAAGRRSVEDALDKLAADVASWGGTFGAVAIDVETGAKVFGRNEHTVLNPASNAKLATAAAALRVLGP